MQRISDIKHYRAMLHNARSMDEAVMMEQIRATTQNLPALYVMLCVAAFSLGLCFLEAAPLYLTLGIPAFFIVGSILRISHWQMSQADFTDPDKAKRDFRAMEIGSVTIFIVLGGWICLLFPYAEGARETQLALFTGLIGPVGMMCSMPRPRIVAIGLIGTLFVFSALFVLAHPASYSFIVVPMAVSYLVFFKVSYAHKQRIGESVNLHSELVSENERASGLAESNRFLALSDTLTGLPNRRRFFEQINLFFDRCPDGEMPIVGLVDPKHRLYAWCVAFHDLDEGISIRHGGWVVGYHNQCPVGRAGQTHHIGFNARCEVQKDVVILERECGEASGQTSNFLIWQFSESA